MHHLVHTLLRLIRHVAVLLILWLHSLALIMMRNMVSWIAIIVIGI